MKTFLIGLFLLPALAFACVDPTYDVYPSCEAPATTFKRTITIDPAKGETLAAFVTAKKILPGDHVVLLAGQHGTVGSLALAAGDWTWLDFQSGAEITGINSRTSKLLVTGATFVGGTKQFIQYGGSNIVVADSHFIGAKDISSWTAKEWMAAPSSLYDDNGTCVSFTRNDIKNVRFGIQIYMRAKGGDPKSAIANALVTHNKLDGISGDFMRPLGSNIDMSFNTATNGMVSAADGDGNHDDFIQMFAYPLAVPATATTPAVPAAIFDNVKINNNTFVEWDGTRSSLRGEYQGISCFDGVYSNVEIKNNVVLGSAYWLIDGQGMLGVTIDHNTAVNVYKDENRLGRISVGNGKLGQVPTGVVVTNNISNYFSAPSDAKVSNNISVGRGVGAGAKVFTKFDVKAGVFDLHPLKGGPADGKGAGAL